LRLALNSDRWEGVPFYIRAGKNRPVTCTEIMVIFKRLTTVYSTISTLPNHIRFRISPDTGFSIGMLQMAAGEEMVAVEKELSVAPLPFAGEQDAYERVLSDAMAGNATLFARQDYVEEAWRIVDPYLKKDTPVFSYKPQTWGPAELKREMDPPGGWHDPKVIHI